MKETVYIYGITRRLDPHAPVIEVTSSLDKAIEATRKFIDESMSMGRYPSRTILKEMIENNWTFKNFVLCILNNCDGEVLIDMIYDGDLHEIIFIKEKEIDLEEVE